MPITIKEENPKIEIYCDGAVSKNGTSNAIGGWGFAIWINDILFHESFGKVEHQATNQRCELLAAINALDSIVTAKYEVFVFSDSAYLCNAFNDKWFDKWKRTGWLNSNNQPVANQDLWEKLIPYYYNKSIHWIKVKGHANNARNEYVDALAVQGRLS